MPLAANALSVSVDVVAAKSSAGGAEFGDFTGSVGSYGAILPGGTSWIPAGTEPNVVTAPTGGADDRVASPFGGTPFLNTNDYFAVQPRGPVAGRSPDPVKLDLGGTVNSFTFLWGSIDVENSVTFFSGTDSVVKTGTDIKAAIDAEDASICTGPTTGNSTFLCSALLTFTDTAGFDSIVFSAGTDDGTPKNSFEFAMVPLPAAKRQRARSDA